MPKDSETWTIFLSSGPLRSRPRLSVSLHRKILVGKKGFVTDILTKFVACRKKLRVGKKYFLRTTWQNLWPKDGLGSLASATAIHLWKKKKNERVNFPPHPWWGLHGLLHALRPLQVESQGTRVGTLPEVWGIQEWVLYLGYDFIWTLKYHRNILYMQNIQQNIIR